MKGSAVFEFSMDAHPNLANFVEVFFHQLNSTITFWRAWSPIFEAIQTAPIILLKFFAAFENLFFMIARLSENRRKFSGVQQRCPIWTKRTFPRGLCIRPWRIFRTAPHISCEFEGLPRQDSVDLWISYFLQFTTIFFPVFRDIASCYRSGNALI